MLDKNTFALSWIVKHEFKLSTNSHVKNLLSLHVDSLFDYVCKITTHR